MEDESECLEAAPDVVRVEPIGGDAGPDGHCGGDADDLAASDEDIVGFVEGGHCRFPEGVSVFSGFDLVGAAPQAIESGVKPPHSIVESPHSISTSAQSSSSLA